MKKLPLIFASFLLLFGITGCGQEKKKESPENTGNNTHEGVIKEDVLGEDFKISNITLHYDEETNTSTYTATISNISSEEKVVPDFKVTLKKNGEEVITIDASAANTILNPNESTNVVSIVAFDLREVTDVSYSILKKEE